MTEFMHKCPIGFNGQNFRTIKSVIQYVNTYEHPKFSYRDNIDSSTCNKHIAGNLLEQNQIIPFNTWVCLCHDTNTARNQKQNDIKRGIGMWYNSACARTIDRILPTCPGSVTLLAGKNFKRCSWYQRLFCSCM